MSGRSGLLLVLWASLLLRSAVAEEVVLRGATVHTAAGSVLAPGDVRIKDGAILELGARIEAGGARGVDLSGLHLYPGLIAADCSLGLSEIGSVRASQDTAEVGDYSPDVDSWVAVNPDSELIPVARANGITHALVAPEGGTVAGRSALIALRGWTWEEMVVRAPAALHINWPSMALDVTPREEGKGKGKKESKSLEEQAELRRAKLLELDTFFQEARAYWDARLASRKGAREPMRHPAWEAMRGAVLGETPVIVHAHGVREITAAVEWAGRRGLSLVIAGGRDAWRVAGLLAEKQVPVLLETVMEVPARDYDPHDANFRAPEVLRQAGVLFALSPSPGTWSVWDLRNLPLRAAFARAHGLPEEDALASITRNPAIILGVGDRLGTIEAGKEASLFAADGDILDVRTRVVRVWIAGAETSLETRHTRLYEKYRGRPTK